MEYPRSHDYAAIVYVQPTYSHYHVWLPETLDFE